MTMKAQHIKIIQHNKRKAYSTKSLHKRPGRSYINNLMIYLEAMGKQEQITLKS